MIELILMLIILTAPMVLGTAAYTEVVRGYKQGQERKHQTARRAELKKVSK